MPIYAFECDACGHNFERLQKLSDADPTVCPECGAEQVRRQLTAPQFRLAGGGWYETDFKKEGDKKRNLAGEGGATPESRPGDGKPADSKPVESKSADSKPADSKSGDGKAAVSKPAEAKPAATKAENKPAA